MAAPATPTAPSVAFEIVIEKKGSNDSSPTIQKKLAARANSPRKALRLADLDRMLKAASKRKEEIAVEGLARTASHNANVQNVYHEKILRETSGIDALEKHLRSKLTNAEAKRDGVAASWARKLAAKAKAKARRAVRAKKEVATRGRKLGAKIDGAGTAAELRREERQLRVREGLALANQEKLRRGQLAIGLAEEEAVRAANQSEQKIVSANHRREMAIEGKVDSIRTQTSGKLQKVAAVRSQEEQRAAQERDRIDAKIRLAEERREKMIADKVLALQQSSKNKSGTVADKQKEKETTSKKLNKEIQSKILSASARKEGILATKVKAVSASQHTKSEHTKNSWRVALNESRELKRTSDKRLEDAAQRKNKLMKEMVAEILEANKSKLERVAQKNKRQEQEERRGLVEFEAKLAAASASRTNGLLAKSSAKKKLLSPQLSPDDKDPEERINSANRHREEFLASKVEKANGKNNKDSTIKKALFAAMSPRHHVGDNIPKKQTMPNEEPKQDGPGVPLIAIGGIAVVLVGLLLLCKRGTTPVMDASSRDASLSRILKSALPFFYGSP